MGVSSSPVTVAIVRSDTQFAVETALRAYDRVLRGPEPGISRNIVQRYLREAVEFLLDEPADALVDVPPGLDNPDAASYVAGPTPAGRCADRFGYLRMFVGFDAP